MDSTRPTSRRSFVKTLSQAAGTSVLMSYPLLSQAHESVPAVALTVNDVMSMLLKTIPGAPFSKTVDTLKSGTPDQVVTGIVSTMFATVAVIEKAVAMGANFIIVHEPTFYNHADETDWLTNDSVFRRKHELLVKHGIAVWRFHDYWHAHQPDGIRTGMMKALGWSTYADTDHPELITIPATSLQPLITHVKDKLGIRQLRIVGDLNQPCQRLVLLPGAPGGRSQIKAIDQFKPDVILCGEVSEWETPEYVRDARRQGQKISLVVLGHIMSEAAGMDWLASWLQPKISGVKVTYVPSENPFTYV